MKKIIFGLILILMLISGCGYKLVKEDEKKELVTDLLEGEGYDVLSVDEDIGTEASITTTMMSVADLDVQQCNNYDCWYQVNLGFVALDIAYENEKDFYNVILLNKNGNTTCVFLIAKEDLKSYLDKKSDIEDLSNSVLVKCFPKI